MPLGAHHLCCPAESSARHQCLPHRRSGWSSGRMRLLRSSSDRFSTPAVIGTVPSASRPLAIAGWPSRRRNCCRYPTVMWCSPFPGLSLLWACRINAGSMLSCFAPSPKPCSRSLPIGAIWGRALAFWPCFTPGVRTCYRILIHDAWHYHLLPFQRTKESDFPDSPPGVSACLSEEVAQRGCVAKIEERTRIGSEADRDSDFRQPGRTLDR